MLLSGCISDVWTGANLVYDRHHIYIKVDDFQLNANANRALYHDNAFKGNGCSLELAVFNRDLLIVGRVPTEALRQEAYARLRRLVGIRRLFHRLNIGPVTANAVEDSWITTKIRSQILADSSIDPHAFKVITYEQIVYLMGDVVPNQANKVILFARQWTDVSRVVTLFRYYHLSD